MHPTKNQFTAYSDAYDYYNEVLFDGQLPRCLLNFSRKNKRVLGFFSPQRWLCGDERAHEISLNPDVLKRPLRETMSTLVHEMVHVWQQEFGTPSRNGYHNREWGEQMDKIGLVPSNTGQPGGKRVGQQMHHYVAEAGPFDLAFNEMPEFCKLPWVSGVQGASKTAPKVESKVKYNCPGCGQNAWGKPGLCILCATCVGDDGGNIPMKHAG